jgi:hypothetical protein
LPVKKGFGYLQPVAMLKNRSFKAQLPTADRRLRIPSHHFHNFQEQDRSSDPRHCRKSETKSQRQICLSAQFDA